MIARFDVEPGLGAERDPTAEVDAEVVRRAIGVMLKVAPITPCQPTSKAVVEPAERQRDAAARS